MDIAPVTVVQLARGRDGRQYEISGEAGRIAKMLRDLDPSLRVGFNEAGMFFVVKQLLNAHRLPVENDTDAVREECVMRVPMGEWDERVVRDFEMRAHELRHGINPADRLDALDAKRKARDEYEVDQMIRERAEPLFRCFQRNIIGTNPRAFISSRRFRQRAVPA